MPIDPLVQDKYLTGRIMSPHHMIKVHNAHRPANLATVCEAYTLNLNNIERVSESGYPGIPNHCTVGEVDEEADMHISVSDTVQNLIDRIE
ncbi:unnamed protein product [Ambrosiozyma monospora]|uniref:Unnamed protein product n=1 Tax=Ambrosiozyma monospora TaxID=43982 RepID=A0A9W6Z301_AMBMO|nr:unnamed protein product [Ambrosiozyma monospora]